MLYDVTLPISPAMAHWPGDPGVEAEHRGGRVKTSRWVMGSHAGTHVDAPAHFLDVPWTMDDLDLDALVGPCRLLDMGEAPLVSADLLRAHDLHGVARLLLKTRNSAGWVEDPTRFREDFVGLSLDAAELLVGLDVRLVGVDGLSVAPFRGGDGVHEVLLGARVILLEGLALAEVPAGDYELLCAPLKLAGADGAPARTVLRTLTG